MKRYALSIPITGLVYMEIEAESEEDAKQKAFMSDVTTENIDEWDMHESIVTGNVFHGHLNEIDIEEL